MAIYGMPRRRFKSNRPDIHIALICLCLVHPIAVRVSPQSVAAVLALHQAPAPWQSLGKIHRRMSWCLMGLWPAMFFRLVYLVWPRTSCIVIWYPVHTCPMQFMNSWTQDHLRSSKGKKFSVRLQTTCPRLNIPWKRNNNAYQNSVVNCSEDWVRAEHALFPKPPNIHQQNCQVHVSMVSFCSPKLLVTSSGLTESKPTLKDCLYQLYHALPCQARLSNIFQHTAVHSRPEIQVAVEEAQQAACCFQPPCSVTWISQSFARVWFDHHIIFGKPKSAAVRCGHYPLVQDQMNWLKCIWLSNPHFCGHRPRHTISLKDPKSIWSKSPKKLYRNNIE